MGKSTNRNAVNSQRSKLIDILEVYASGYLKERSFWQIFGRFYNFLIIFASILSNIIMSAPEAIAVLAS